MKGAAMDTNLNIDLTLSSTQQENNLEIVGNCSHLAGQKCDFCVTNIQSIPDDVMFDILVRVPAQDIYHAARLVCRSWLRIISNPYFLRSHFQQSVCGFLIQDMGSEYERPVFVSTQNDQIEISNYNHKFNARKVISSCNGLVLDCLACRNDIYISNPATKQRFALPPFYVERVPYGYAAMAYAASSMEYKVVRSYLPFNYSSKIRYCTILTAGVDKDWTRRVNTQHLSLAANDLLYSEHPSTIEGFVYWAHRNRFRPILILNAETEIITEHPVPRPLRHHYDSEKGYALWCCDGSKKILCRYIPMGSYISMLIGDHTTFSWELWIMKPEVTEWTHVTSIDIEVEKCRFEMEEFSALDCEFHPVGWSKPGEVLVFIVIESKTARFYIAYDVGTRQTLTFELEYYHKLNYHIPHRNTLLWFGGTTDPVE